jgi:hypothetical protein
LKNFIFQIDIKDRALNRIIFIEFYVSPISKNSPMADIFVFAGRSNPLSPQFSEKPSFKLENRTKSERVAFAPAASLIGVFVAGGSALATAPLWLVGMIAVGFIGAGVVAYNAINMPERERTRVFNKLFSPLQGLIAGVKQGHVSKAEAQKIIETTLPTAIQGLSKEEQRQLGLEGKTAASSVVQLPSSEGLRGIPRDPKEGVFTTPMSSRQKPAPPPDKEQPHVTHVFETHLNGRTSEQIQQTLDQTAQGVVTVFFAPHPIHAMTIFLAPSNGTPRNRSTVTQRITILQNALNVTEKDHKKSVQNFFYLVIAMNNHTSYKKFLDNPQGQDALAAAQIFVKLKAISSNATPRSAIFLHYMTQNRDLAELSLNLYKHDSFETLTKIKQSLREVLIKKDKNPLKGASDAEFVKAFREIDVLP